MKNMVLVIALLAISIIIGACVIEESPDKEIVSSVIVSSQIVSSTVESAIEESIKEESVIEEENTFSMKYVTEEQYKEYPTACIIWEYLRNLGYNKAVCAGIMGNMMSESGGHTLNINWKAKNKYGDCYGICQWWYKYYPTIKKKNLNEQLDFLRDTIQIEFKNCGHYYAEGYTYEKFLKIKKPKKAALVFGCVYERCGKGGYYVRQQDAQVAYNYFKGNT